VSEKKKGLRPVAERALEEMALRVKGEIHAILLFLRIKLKIMVRETEAKSTRRGSMSF
jgi:hypothetical protein